MQLVEIILFGLSVCADCFAVSLCSSIGLKKRDAGTIVKIALCFAIIQTAFLLVGWACGDVLTSLINKVAKWEALALLVYVGGSMIYSALFSKKSEKSDLNGLKNIALAGIATSMDALVIGGSLSLAGQGWIQTIPQAVSVFIFTALSVLVGILCGGKLARKAGRWAECIGGVVLIGIGLSIVL